MKTNLVIGSEGLIGKPFCKYLEEKGEKVIRFDIKRRKEEDARFAKLPLKHIEKIYFLAWDVGGSKYLYKPALQKAQLAWNVQLMKNVFEQIAQTKRSFLFTSSQLSEEVDTVYGVTKRLGEVWTRLLGGVCIRIWNAYGVMEEENIKSHVISDFIYQALTQKKIKMLTNGEEWRQFTHISDLSSAFYLALNTMNLRRCLYDASSYEWVRVRDVAAIICDLTGAKLYPGERVGHDPIPAPNMGRIPGWLPQVELRDGIRKMIDEAKVMIRNEKRV